MALGASLEGRSRRLVVQEVLAVRVLRARRCLRFCRDARLNSMIIVFFIPRKLGSQRGWLSVWIINSGLRSYEYVSSRSYLTKCDGRQVLSPSNFSVPKIFHVVSQGVIRWSRWWQIGLVMPNSTCLFSANLGLGVATGAPFPVERKSRCACPRL